VIPTAFAAEFAARRHAGQLRKGKDVPYVIHPARVSATLEVAYPNDPELSIAGMLHDTIEDTATPRWEIELIFGKRVADLVWAVTNRPDFRPTNDPAVLRLKAADLFDNISETARDLRAGEPVWDRFKARERKALRWRVYVDEILAIIGNEPLAIRLDAKLRQVEDAIRG
jgi:hypothetical protein